MAQQVFIENIGTETYKERFREREISIPVNGRIKMQRREALIFLGAMSATGKDGRPVEKKLRMLPDGAEIEGQFDDQKKEFICNLDGKKFDSQSELDAHLRTLSSKTVTREQVDAAKRKEA